MNKEIPIIIEKLKDQRSKKVIFLAHCILNENTRYPGGAFREGTVDEIIDELQKKGVGIVQIKCPEQQAWGGVLKEDLLRAFGSRNTKTYKFRKILLPFFIWNTKRIYRQLAREVVREVKDYLDSGFEVLGIVGVAGSPSCGVKTRLDIEKSFNMLASTDVDDLDREKMNHIIQECLEEGQGLFIRALEDELSKTNIKINIYEHDLISEMKGMRPVFKL